MNLSFMPQFSRRTTAWAIAFSSLGLAALAAVPATGWSEEAPGKARVATADQADYLDAANDEEEEAGSVRIHIGDDDEAAGSVSIRRDEPEESASIRIRGDAPAEAAGSVRIRKSEPAPAPAGVVRIKNLPPPKSPALQLGASAPRQSVAARPVQSARVNPTARRYPFEQPVASVRPAATPARPDAVKQAAAAPAASATAAAGKPSDVQPVQHQSNQRTPFLDDEDDEVESEEPDSAPAMFEADDESVALAEVEPVAGTDNCPPVTDADVQAFSSGIDVTTQRHPIRTLRADMQMRLSREHSSLMDDNDRAIVREKGRCAAENDRAIVRQYYRQKYGAGYDRGTGDWSDESLAPEFPFCYHPLYFEDANLERCGYSKGCICQTLISGFQFYGNVALLPVKMLMLQPCSYVYPQCDCEPCTRYGCCDNMWGPCPEGLFRSPCYSSRRCR